ncbi:NifB/NifX family molybdenum-iron cluster-binding protein [bacterium]|nr:NifB/NifX family molybdenum-iron cluster-binding protein [bacterium]
MRFAIPLGGAGAANIHEVLDNAERIIVVTVDDHAVTAREEIDVCDCPSAKRARWFHDNDIDWVVCNGVSTPLASRLEESGVHVVPWISGAVEKIIDDFVTGRIPDASMYMA